MDREEIRVDIAIECEREASILREEAEIVREIGSLEK
jgi:hypothetical protein